MNPRCVVRHRPEHGGWYVVDMKYGRFVDGPLGEADATRVAARWNAQVSA